MRNGSKLLLAAAVLAGSLVAPETALAAAQHVAQSASHKSNEAVRFGLLIGIGGLGLIAVLASVVGPGRAVVIGVDNRVSTSKTVALVWTVVVAGALLGLVYADLLNHPQALTATNNSGVVGQYAVLFGGPLGAAIAAKGIVTQQVNKDPAAKSKGTSTSVNDLVLDDAGNTDLGDLQYVLFNLVALIFVIGSVFVYPSRGLPHLPDVLLGLTSVSAVGYASKKALSPQAVIGAKIEPDHGSGSTLVQIRLTGFSQPVEPHVPMWVRFGDDVGTVSEATITDGEVMLQRSPGQAVPEPTKPVKVVVITANGTVVNAGQFTYD